MRTIRCSPRARSCAAPSTSCTRRGASRSSTATCWAALLDLRDLTVSDVMIHRTEMITINADDPPEAVVKAVLAAPVTRVPLWRETSENIIGVLHAKDPAARDPGGGRRPREGRHPVARAAAVVRGPTSARCPSSSRRSGAARPTSRSWSTSTAR